MNHSGPLFYIRHVLFWTLVISMGGAVCGALIYPAVGLLTGVDATAAKLALKGARELGFLAFIWAPGIGIVLAYHRAYRSRQAAAKRAPEAKSTD